MGLASIFVDRFGGAATVRGALAVALLGLGAMGRAQAVQLASGSYPASSKPYPAVHTDGNTADNQWGNNAT